MAKQEHEISVTCEPCEGHGVLLASEPTVGIICAHCSGHGHVLATYKLFTGRKTRKGITRVRRSGQGISAFSAEPSSDAGVSYADFLKGKMP